MNEPLAVTSPALSAPGQGKGLLGKGLWLPLLGHAIYMRRIYIYSSQPLLPQTGSIVTAQSAWQSGNNSSLSREYYNSDTVDDASKSVGGCDHGSC